MKKLCLGAALTALGLTATGRVAAQRPPSVDTARILAADSEPGNWLTHGRTYAEQRFEGTIDGRLLALDAKTGRQLWSYDTDLATLAGPVSYSVRGGQYVAVLSGDGSAFMLIGGVLGPRAATSVNGRVYAFKIGGRAARRPVPVQKAVFPKPPAIAASAEDVRRGGMLYDQFCMTCHGLAAVGGVNPDLRRSAMLLDRAAWRTFVGGEGMPSRAMPRFSKHLTADDVERIRAYVASELAYTAADRPATSSGRQP